MCLYTRMLSVALRLITKYGRDVTWRSMVITATNVNTPWDISTASYTDYTVKMVQTSWSNLQSVLYYVAKKEYPSGSYLGLLAATAFTPKVNDVVIDGGKTIKIMNIDEIKPGPTILMYIVEFER